MKKKTQVAIFMATMTMQVQSMEIFEPEQVTEVCSDLYFKSKYVFCTGKQQGKTATIDKVYFNDTKPKDRETLLNLTLIFEPKEEHELIIEPRALSELINEKVHLELYLRNVRLKNLDYLFYNSRALTYIKLEEIKGNLTSMTSMCSGCINLKNIDVGTLNTSHIKTMDRAFFDCTALKKVNLNNLDTSKVRTMKEMFANCDSLKSLGIDKIDTSRVQNMDGMFYGCAKVEKLDISNLNTKLLQTAEKLCAGCSSLKSIKLGQKDFSNMQNASRLFENCPKLQWLDLSKIKFKNKTYTDNFIRNCESLMSVKYHPASRKKMKYYEKQCEGLTSLNKKRKRTRSVDLMQPDAEKFEANDNESKDSQIEDKKELESDSDEV